MSKTRVVKVSTLIVFFVSLLLLPGMVHGKKIKSIDGVPIDYTIQGEGEPTLVLVHCWCCNKGFWDAQVAHFAKKHKVVTLDLAGHGVSGKERKEWSMKAYGEDVAVVVKELKLKKMILVGHSMGGPVCVEAANLMPGKVLGIIAVDTLTNVEQKFTDEQLAGFLAPMKKDFAGSTRQFLAPMAPQKDEKLKEKILSTMASASPTVGIESMKAMFKMDLPKRVKSAAVHIRCINAKANPTNLEAGKRHAKSYDAKFMEGVGHFLHMEQPETFNKLMKQAIQELLKLNR